MGCHARERKCGDVVSCRESMNCLAMTQCLGHARPKRSVEHGQAHAIMQPVEVPDPPLSESVGMSTATSTSAGTTAAMMKMASIAKVRMRSGSRRCQGLRATMLLLGEAVAAHIYKDIAALQDNKRQEVIQISRPATRSSCDDLIDSACGRVRISLSYCPALEMISCLP